MHRNRIYVNRDLRLDKIEMVGFDMDYTLALYHQDAYRGADDHAPRCTSWSTATDYSDGKFRGPPYDPIARRSAA